MQFGFKSNHSTTMCSAIYMEIINQYKMKGSNVYSCMLDASKAFDRVHFGSLFRLLLKRNLPLGIVRLLLDSYTRQQASTVWDQQKSSFFNITNGVKQGGVISPRTFTIYIDQLLLRLKKSGIGCHIHGKYMGSLGYADDVTLLSPSIRGLNRMLSICEDFGKEYFIKFNSKKSMCIKYGEKYDCEKSQLNEETIIWVDSVKHLGNIINNDLNDIDDCKMKCSSFISSFNKLHFSYANVQPCILSNLFKSFCTSYYGSSLWSFSSEGFRKITTLWNIAVRKIFILPNTTHKHLLGPLLNQPHIVDQLFRRNVCFLYSLRYTSNDIINVCFNNAIDNAHSIIGGKISYLRDKLNVNFYEVGLRERLKKIDVLLKITHRISIQISNLKNLLSIRSGNRTIDYLNIDEINYMICHICTE